MRDPRLHPPSQVRGIRDDYCLNVILAKARIHAWFNRPSMDPRSHSPSQVRGAGDDEARTA